ncbi:uncharacterized protein EMH_0020170 [Eimeria mitis]|uniref:Uncharacterized protein n=1 Tax=Eimeria mitis TaxID=44415 RepID=U6KG32_9EIME|nr:uncharacterized protein EMH_0020170 [Eimeria mitis]CDJ34413.1 hypothetical protein, conserved [Eimeria mitis]
MRQLWIAVLPAAAILFLTVPGTFTLGADDVGGQNSQSLAGRFESSSQVPSASPSKGTPLQSENSSESSDPWGFIAPLMPAVRAIGDMFKPIIDASGIEREIGDIVAALNETSQNPFFLFGFDDTPPEATSHPSRHGKVQRQQLGGGKSPQTKPSQPKQKGSSMLPFRGLFSPDEGSSETPPGSVDGTQPHKASEKEHSGHSEEEDGLWRQWAAEDLDLL